MEDDPLKRLRDELLDAHDRQRAEAAHAHEDGGRPLWRRRRAQLALALVVAAVLLAAGLTSIGSTPGPAPAAAAALQRLAQIAARGPSLVPGPSQYLHVRSVSDDPAFVGDHGCVTAQLDRQQAWIAADGTAFERDTLGSWQFASPTARARCQPLGSVLPHDQGQSSEWFAAGCYALGPAGDETSLSTDPQKLLAQMRMLEGDPDSPADDFTHVGDFLRETDAGPALRAALYRAAALIPGVELLGSVRDHLGRTGLGVAFTAKGKRTELILNRRTAVLMGEQTTGSAPGSDSWAVYFQSRVVDSQPRPSPLPLTPPCGPGGASRSHHVPGGEVLTGV